MPPTLNHGAHFVITTSAHDCHTWAVDSQSHRKPRTYSPGGTSGTFKLSYMVMLFIHSPEQSPWARPAQPCSLPLAPHESFSSPHGGGTGWPFVLQPGFEPQ